MKMRYNASGQISQRESMMLEGRQNNSHSRGQVFRQDYLIILLQGSHPFKPLQMNNACVHTQHICIVGVCLCVQTLGQELFCPLDICQLNCGVIILSITKKFGSNSDSMSVFVKQNKQLVIGLKSALGRLSPLNSSLN